MILSIIIPVYNVEQYIVRCLDSVMDQDIPHDQYEVIVINDGSTDNGLALIQDYAKDHPNIVLIDQKNSGSGASRNIGLDHARGKYVMFVDSDDFIDTNCLKTLIQTSENNHLDVLVGSYKDAYEKEGKLYHLENKKFGNNNCSVMSGIEYLSKNSFYTSACMKVYRRDFLLEHNLQNRINCYCEDIDYIVKVIYYADSIQFVPIDFYNYYQRTSSITASANVKRELDLIKGLVATKEFSDKENNPILTKVVNSYINMLILYMYSRSTSYRLSENMIIYKSIKKNKLISLSNNNSIKNRILLGVLSFSPIHFSLFLEIRKLYGYVYHKLKS